MKSVFSKQILIRSISTTALIAATYLLFSTESSSVVNPASGLLLFLIFMLAAIPDIMLNERSATPENKRSATPEIQSTMAKRLPPDAQFLIETNLQRLVEMIMRHPRRGVIMTVRGFTEATCDIITPKSWTVV